MDDEVVDLITQVHVTLSEQRDSCVEDLESAT